MVIVPQGLTPGDLAPESQPQKESRASEEEPETGIELRKGRNKRNDLLGSAGTSRRTHDGISTKRNELEKEVKATLGGLKVRLAIPLSWDVKQKEMSGTALT